VSTPRTKTHELIYAALEGETMTGAQIANRARIEWMGAESALRGMLKRGEVVRLKQRAPGEPYRYRRAA
jgi:hypothetical protein